MWYDHHSLSLTALWAGKGAAGSPSLGGSRLTGPLRARGWGGRGRGCWVSTAALSPGSRGRGFGWRSAGAVHWAPQGPLQNGGLGGVTLLTDAALRPVYKRAQGKPRVFSDPTGEVKGSLPLQLPIEAVTSPPRFKRRLTDNTSQGTSNARSVKEYGDHVLNHHNI